MPKSRHKTRPRARMTEEQVRKIVAKAIEENTRTALEQDREQQGVTIKQTDELPSGLKLESVCPSCGNGARLTPCPVCNPRIDHAKPLPEAQTVAATSSTVRRSPELDTGPQVQCDDSSGPSPKDSRESPPPMEATLDELVNFPRVTRGEPIRGLKISGVEPEDIAAALARSPAYTGPRVSDEEIDQVLAANGVPPAPVGAPVSDPPPVRFTSMIPEMTDGDLGITKVWAHQPPPEPVYVRETFHHVTVAKPSLARWMADAGVILRWGAVMLALAVVLVVAIDYGSAREVASEPSVVTFNLRF